MLPQRRVLPARAWRVPALLLLSLCLAGPPAPALATLAAPESAATSGGFDTRPTALTAGGEGATDQAGLAAYGQLPLSFEPNQGQTNPSVDFLAHGPGYTLFLSSGEAVLSLRQPTAASASSTPAPVDATPSVLRVQLDGADPHPRARGEEPLAGTVNYLVGDDPAQWHTDVPTFRQVRYPDIYPGIDLVYYGNHGQLEYDFVVAPGSDPGPIRLGFAGADQVQVDDAGALLLQLPEGQLRQAPPVIYQEGPQGRQVVAGGYILNEQGQVGFAVSAYDPGQPLIIDPVLVYSTYLGGSGRDEADGIAVSAAGDAFITGSTASTNFPVTSAVFPFQQTFRGSTDAFVSRIDPTGTFLIYSTFLGGGSSNDSGFGIAVDAAGDAYVTGITDSARFPTTPGALQTTLHGPIDAFVSKLNPSGSALVYSTFLGGSGDDAGIGIVLDATGDAYVAGSTRSTNFPTTAGAFQTTFHGTNDGFVSKLNPTGTALVYSTYLGGSADSAHGIALDAAGNAYVTGHTESTDFPITPTALQRTPGGAFVSKLNPTGTALVYSTFLGGSSGDFGSGIAVDAAGNAYATGFTNSASFPTTPGAFQRTIGGVSDAFVSKLNPTGTALVYSTYLGGGSENGDLQAGIAVDGAGNAYVTGLTESPHFPTTPGAFQTTFHGPIDAFVTKLNPTGSGLVYSSFLGGSGDDRGTAIALDAAANAYVAGIAFSSDFPTTPGALQRTFGGQGDAFVAKIAPGPPGCTITALLPGPPAQLRVAVHADRGLASLVVTQATNASVSLPAFAPGTTDTLLVTATKLDQTARATVTLRATDRTGSFTDCDPVLVTVGQGPGERAVQVLHHLARAESHVTITNNTPGVHRVRLVVNGRRFELTDLHDGETRSVDVSAAMRKGTSNTLVVVAHGPRGSSAVVLVSDS